jgi:hypothetical protein
MVQENDSGVNLGLRSFTPDIYAPEWRLGGIVVVGSRLADDTLDVWLHVHDNVHDQVADLTPFGVFSKFSFFKSLTFDLV